MRTPHQILQPQMGYTIVYLCREYRSVCLNAEQQVDITSLAVTCLVREVGPKNIDTRYPGRHAFCNSARLYLQKGESVSTSRSS